ncbi:MAG: enolase C-terminal domain-like protein [Polyangiales bacterium]
MAEGYEGLVAERRVSFARPAANARARWTERTTLLVAFRGPEGAVGRSEASPLPDFGDDSLDRARAVLGAIDWARLGAETDEAGDLDELLACVHAHVAPSPAARFAVEMALLDRRGVIDGRPTSLLLAEALGVSVASSVRLAAWPQGDDALTLLDEANAAVARGHRTLKIKLGRDVDVELAVTRTLRREHPGVALRFDGNGAIPRRDLPRVLEQLAAVGAELLEEPRPLDELLDGVESAVPIALDEGLAGLAPERLDEAIDRGAVGALVIKPMALSLRESLRLARLARHRGLPCIVSHLLDGPRAHAAYGALALAIGGPLAHGLGRHAGLDAWAAVGASREVGVELSFDASPGLGALP